jgi:hypothetical protein
MPDTIVKACLGALTNSKIKMGCYGEMYTLKNMHKPEAQVNLGDEQRKLKHVSLLKTNKVRPWAALTQGT